MGYWIVQDTESHPEAEDVGVIFLEAEIPGEYGPLTFSSKSFARDFIDDEQGKCKIKEDLNSFSLEAGINDDEITNQLMGLVDYVVEATCPTNSRYSPGCALYVSLQFYQEEINYIDDAQIDEVQIDEVQTDEVLQLDDAQIDEVQTDEVLQLDDAQIDEVQIDEVVQLSFDQTSNIRFRPASKHAVKSLSRKIYNKKIQKDKKKTKIYKHISLEDCTICLEEFRNGGKVVTLPCGHDFDEECMVKWLETSHMCPLCRFQLPREDEETSIVLYQN